MKTQSGHGHPDTVNQGGASKRPEKERDAGLDAIVGNVAEKGEKPSPSDRDRGETSSAG